MISLSLHFLLASHLVDFKLLLGFSEYIHSEREVIIIDNPSTYVLQLDMSLR